MKTYHLDIDCKALSGRPYLVDYCRTNVIRTYLQVGEEEAVLAVLALLELGLPVKAILEHIGEERVAKHFRNERW